MSVDHYDDMTDEELMKLLPTLTALVIERLEMRIRDLLERDQTINITGEENADNS